MIEPIKRKLRLIFLSCDENGHKPRLYTFDFLFRLVLIVFVFRIITLPFYFFFPKNIFFAEIVASDLISLLNEQRKNLGLTPLNQDEKLTKAAVTKAKDMLDLDYFGHKNPDGVSAWYWIEKQGYDYKLAGENLAIGFLDSEEVHLAWNNSDLHKQNLLNPDFKDVGISVLTGEFQGGETTVVVQLFGKPSTEVALIPPAEAGVSEEPVVEVPSETEIPIEVPEESQGTGETLEEIILEEIRSKEEAEVLAEEALIVSTENESLEFNFLEFLVKRYNELAQKIILVIALVFIFFLILNMFLTLRLPLPPKPKLSLLKDYVPGAILALLIILGLSFLSKSLLIQFIPHNLVI